MDGGRDANAEKCAQKVGLSGQGPEAAPSMEKATVRTNI